MAFQNSSKDNPAVEPALLKLAYIHVLRSNFMAVPIRKKEGAKK
jgi:hypothetical protein